MPGSDVNSRGNSNAPFSRVMPIGSTQMSRDNIADELNAVTRTSTGPFWPNRNRKIRRGVEPCGSLVILPFTALASQLGIFNPPYASSASRARRLSRSKNARDWPLNNPSSVSALAAPLAAPFVSVGRIIEHLGKVLLRNGHGSGIMRFACNVSG